MAVISEFLVALGFDGQDFEKGLKKAETDLGLFRSTALQVGATLGGALSLKALTLDFSKQNLQLDQMSKKLGVARDTLHGLDIAFQAYGASEGESIGLLEQLASTQAGLLRGDIGLTKALAETGINVDSITNAKNSYESLLAIADQASQMNQKQRVNLANTLGLSPASLDLIVQGREKIAKLSDEFGKSRPHYKEMADASRSFTEEWSRMMNNVGGVLDPVATELTKFSTRVIQVISSLTSEGSTVRDVLSGVARNVDKVAIALGALAVGKTVGSLYRLAKAFSFVKMSAGGVGGVLAGLALIVGPEIAGALAEKNVRNPENLEYDGLHDEEPEVVIEKYTSKGGEVETTAKPYEKAKTEAVQSAKVGLEPKSNDIGSKRQPEPAQQPRTAQSGGDKTLVIKLQMDSQVIDERIVRINEQSAQEITESYKSRTVR